MTMEPFLVKVAPVLLGYLMDLIFGDPPFLYHPVRAMGLYIEKGEKKLRRIFPKTPKGEFTAGLVLSISLIIGVFCFYGFILILTAQINLWLYLAVKTYLIYRILAVKSLKTESMKVHDALKNEDLPGARLFLSYIVGRDTENLNAVQTAKAAVETVAENTSDGVLAPLFYIFLGGPVLGLMYKAVNTLDSMIGYKNEKYLHFGRFAAKTDDAVNFIPSRLSAAVMLLAGRLAGLNFRNGLKIFRRDRFNHTSPNSAQTEAVCAGLLDIQLGGPSVYFGKIIEKPYIGDLLKEVEKEDIVKVNQLMISSSALAVLIYAAVTLILSMG